MDILIQESPASVHTENHSCESHLRGDWIIWTCPECEGYERRLNWRTGEMKAKKAPTQAHHYGMNLTQGISPRLAEFLN